MPACAAPKNFLSKAMKKVDLYTDGACSGNPGAGGYGAILIYRGLEKEISGGEPSTTNNRMEIRAVIEGLACLKEPCEVTIYSDSAYTVNAFNEGWIYGWMKNGWKKADGKPILNAELRQQLYAAVSKHKSRFVKVKGHADNEYNNRCDALARAAIQKQGGTA